MQQVVEEEKGRREVEWEPQAVRVLRMVPEAWMEWAKLEKSQ